MNKSKLNAQAKQLHMALTGLGINLTYTQALEGMARATGDRTLHVCQAKKPVPTDGEPLLKLARRLAVRVMFKSSGDWLGKESELLVRLSEVFADSDEKSSRLIESEVHDLCEAGKPVELKGPYAQLRHEDWTDAFDELVADLAAELGNTAQVDAAEQEHPTYLCEPLLDWRVKAGDIGTDHPDAKPYRMTVKGTPLDRLYVDLTQKRQKTEFSPAVCIEVADGSPVIRVFADTEGDCLFSVHIEEDGLLFESGFFGTEFHRGAPPEGTALAKLYEKITEGRPNDLWHFTNEN